MKAPNKIYIDESRITELGGLADAIVPDNRIETSDVCYIRKDALIEWLEGRMTMEGATEGFVGGYDFALKDVINKINSM